MTILDVAQDMANKFGLKLVFDEAVLPGIVLVYDDVRVHPEAAEFDVAQNGNAVFPIYPKENA